MEGGGRQMAQHGSRIFAARMAAFAAVALMALAVGTSAAAQERPDPRSEIGGLHSKYVDVNGVKARYYEAGTGEPMVMIHCGFTAGSSTANVFSRNIAGLAKRFHVFAVGPAGQRHERKSAEGRRLHLSGRRRFYLRLHSGAEAGAGASGGAFGGRSDCNVSGHRTSGDGQDADDHGHGARESSGVGGRQDPAKT